MTEWIIASSLGAVVGGAVIWFAKDTIQKWILGEQAFAAKLQAKVSTIKAVL